MAPLKASSLRSIVGAGSQLYSPARITARAAVSVSSRSPQPTFLPQVNPAPTQSNQFNALVHALTLSLTTTTSPNLPHLTRLLRSYNPAVSSCTKWQRFAHANPAKQYTRNLVSEVPGLFQLLMLVWTPGMRSPVHDHAGADCLMKVLQGTLRERRWSSKSGEGEMMQTSDKQFGMGKVAYMSDALGVHEVGNPSDEEYAVSLHLYTPPSAATEGCNVYDVANGETRHVMQGAYDSVGGIAGV